MVDHKIEKRSKPTKISTFTSWKENVESDDSDGCIEGPELRAAASSFSKEDANVTEVLRCTSNSSFSWNRPLLRARMRSRLMDPPPFPAVSEGFDKKKSMRMPNTSRVMEEDDDVPFEDLPEELKSTKMSNWTILELISLFLAIAALICSLTMQKLERQTFWRLHL